MSYPLTSAQLEYHDPPRVKVRYVPPARGSLVEHLQEAASGPQRLFVCTACNYARTERGTLSAAHTIARRHAVKPHEQEAPC